MASAISAMEIEGAKDTQYTAAPTRGLGRDAPKTLKFKDINYTVTITEYENPDSCFESGKSCQKPIVKGVSGEVKGGQMLCCLGPSGSGKTSLIHIISGRIKSTSNQSHIVSGEVLVDNQMMTGTAFRRMSGLVTQEDIFNGHLTVYETLYYAAGLILPADIRDARVNEVIELLQLEQCRNTFIGDDADPYIKGISGGEKRRLAIAMEILDPTISLLMADEPTSGLDAAAAQNVINVLRTLADDGLSVITTLHQPRVTIMNKFDLLMIISGGKSIYYGSIADYIPYIENHLNIKIPEHESPYEILLDALNPAIAKESQAPIGLIQNDQEKTEVGELLANAYENSPLGQSEMAKITTSSKGDTVVLQEEEKGFCEKVGHWVNCTWILLLRTFLIKLRDPICLMTQVSSGIIMGLIFGALYWDVYDKSTNRSVSRIYPLLFLNNMYIVCCFYTDNGYTNSSFIPIVSLSHTALRFLMHRCAL
jgi:ABC-type multidrug transport system ATPase subunit